MPAVHDRRQGARTLSRWRSFPRKVGETPHRLSEVIHPAARADIVLEVDNRDRVCTMEHRVVRPQITMADNLLALTQPGRHRRIMEGPDQRGSTTDPAVRKPVRTFTSWNLPIDKGQDLPSVIVIAQRARRTGEPDVDQMPQQRIYIR
jgi:hypothetical protein